MAPLPGIGKSKEISKFSKEAKQLFKKLPKEQQDYVKVWLNHENASLDNISKGNLEILRNWMRPPKKDYSNIPGDLDLLTPDRTIKSIDHNFFKYTE